jgi:hypothetical protein
MTKRQVRVSTVPYEYLPCIALKLLAHYSRGNGVLMPVDTKKVNYVLRKVDKHITASQTLVSLVLEFLRPYMVRVGRKRLAHLSRDSVPEYFARVGKSVDCREWDRRLASLDPRFGLK